ncbi:hypothetical protein EI427_02375 [Flammeovirga pectinis]|uniref:Uncharacterized protein n=1 Tax=Flammeovirga pectinis TaxID=2494373 RepID=A0A3S9NYQ6_9BACT|nr:hypothetical protein [Flammeovirga pectinis]AZQ61102.1 hypothetical protein EI427_02375 [Flammeovirga pectinis]
MIIKYNFKFQDPKSNSDLSGELNITMISETSPVYDVTLNQGSNNVDLLKLMNDVFTQYVESRVYELFSSTREKGNTLTENEYIEIISKEAPTPLVKEVVGDMHFVYDNVDYLQAS